MSIAFEDPILFSASVRENVLLGTDLTGQAADDLVAEALDVARAGFAYGLPDGLDTIIGEEGLSLSGGQRQRIALARAIAVRPRVLLLDDPLSALDVTTEAAVTGRLREMLTGTTTLVVAHRPSTVALADRVAVLEDGRITGVGRHADLLSTHPHYRYVLTALSALDDADGADDARPTSSRRCDRERARHVGDLRGLRGRRAPPPSPGASAAGRSACSARCCGPSPVPRGGPRRWSSARSWPPSPVPRSWPTASTRRSPRSRTATPDRSRWRPPPTSRRRCSAGC